ncbi:hypothetical protein ACFLXP_01160 [Chloroflexota bacterium]
MAISLTKEQMLERFEQRQVQFGDAVGKRVRPQLPFTIETYDDLAGNCSMVVMAFLEVVFTEDK